MMTYLCPWILVQLECWFIPIEIFVIKWQWTYITVQIIKKKKKSTDYNFFLLIKLLYLKVINIVIQLDTVNEHNPTSNSEGEKAF